MLQLEAFRYAKNNATEVRLDQINFFDKIRKHN